MKRYVELTLSFMLFFGIAFAFGQQAFWGGIVGNITDKTGAAVANATVTITNTDTGVQLPIKTNSMGYYQALKLTPGNYKVTAMAPTFASFVRSNITLSGGQQVRVDVPLQVGAPTEVVQVTGATPEINTESATTILGPITTHQTWTLPNTNGPQPWPDPYNQLLNGYADIANSAFSIGGTLSSQNAEVQDGMRMEGQSDVVGGSRGLARPSIDSIQELVVTTSNFSAKYSQQAAIETVLKSGTNNWHGSLWYQHANKAFNAPSYFTHQKTPYLLHQYGGSVGGPIKKDKAFFFFSYQGFKFPNALENFSTIPTAKMRTGDLSEFLDPTFLAASGFSAPTVVKDPQSGLPFPNNVIPQSRISPIATEILSVYPAPNQPGPFTRNLVVDGLLIRKESNFDVRGDYYFNPNQHTYGRFTFFRSPNAASQTSLPGFGGNYFIDNGRNLTVHHVSTLSPHLLNDAMFGMFRNNTPLGPGLFSSDMTAWNKQLGIAGIPPEQDNGFPFITFSQTSITTPVSYGFGENDEYIYEGKDEVTWTRGRHTVQTGFDFRRDEQGSNLPGTGQGNGGTCQFGCLNFNGRWTGLDFADFLLGLPFTSSRMFLSQPDFRNRNEWAGYMQDDIKLTARLNLSLGVRYDYFPIVTSANGLESIFDPASGSLVVPTQQSISNMPSNVILPIPVITAAQAGLPTSLLESNKNDWAPRAGFAYRLLSNSVVRGGFGLYHTPLVSTGRLLLSGPFQATSSFPDVQPAPGGTPAITLANPYVGGSTGKPLLNFFAPNRRVDDPTHYSYNLAIEHQWKANAFTVEYEGKQSNIPYRPQLNAVPPSNVPFSRSRLPFPILGAVTGLKDGANYTYNGLRLNARRQMARGLYFDVAYVFERTIDDLGGISGETGGSPENPFDLTRDRGVSSFMPPSRITINYVYDLPFGKGVLGFGDYAAGKVANAIIGGWETAGTYWWQTSPPLNVTGSFLNAAGQVYDAPNTNTLSGRTDYTGQPIAPTAAQIAQGYVFNPNAFTQHVPSGQYGNVGRGILYAGSSTDSINQSFFRNFRIPWFVGNEGANFRFGFLMYNALNHSNTANPVTSMNSPLFGKRTTTKVGDTRTMMLQARIEF
jgi:hypothetical protein